MSRITVRLPESLHASLAERAEREGVSLNQLLVYALSQSVAIEPVRHQRAQFDALRNKVPAAQAEQALARLLAERAPARTAPKNHRREGRSAR